MRSTPAPSSDSVPRTRAGLPSCSSTQLRISSWSVVVLVSELIGPPSGSALAGLLVVGLLDRVDQVVRGHPRPAGDVELLRDVHEVLLRRVRVDAPGGLAALVGGATGLP